MVNTGAELADNIHRIHEAVQACCERYGRAKDAVQIMAVSKTRTLAEVQAAQQAGITLFGENRVQEARKKFAAGHRFVLHLIGHLQRNKASYAASLFSCVQSIDKVETLRALNISAEKQHKIMEVMLQLNVSKETGKHGFRTAEDLFNAATHLSEFPFLRCTGLMGIAPFGVSPSKIGRAFALLRKTKEVLEEQYQLPLRHLSMGMSSDYSTAIAEGSTMVRLGTAIFSERSYA